MSKVKSFSAEQMAALSRFEDNMRTAVRADWCRALGMAGTREVYDIWISVGGIATFDPNCATCTVRLMKEVGAAYFAQKESEIKAAKAEVDTNTAKSVDAPKKAVKTAKKGK